MCSAEIVSSKQTALYNDAKVKISLRPESSEVEATDLSHKKMIITSLGPGKGFKATTYLETSDYSSSYTRGSTLMLRIGGVLCEATAT